MAAGGQFPSSSSFFLGGVGNIRRLLQDGEEAQWCLFDPPLGLIT